MSATWAAWAALIVAGMLAVGYLAEKVTGLARLVVVTAGLCVLASPVSRAVNPAHPTTTYAGLCVIVVGSAVVRQVRALRSAR